MLTGCAKMAKIIMKETNMVRGAWTGEIGIWGWSAFGVDGTEGDIVDESAWLAPEANNDLIISGLILEIAPWISVIKIIIPNKNR